MLINKLIASIDKRTFIYYVSVGGSAAIINFLIFGLFYDIFGLNYKIAVSFGYIISTSFHFTANRYFTFRSYGKDLSSHLVKYLTMVLINYLITLLIMYFVVSVLNLNPYFGLVCAIGTTFMSGYLMAKCWVFKKENNHDRYA